MKKDLLIKILFGSILLISIFLIISGLLGDSNDNSIIYEEGISVSELSINLTVNESKKIEASVIPSNATYKTLTWTSTNPTIATVNDGYVTGISEGMCIIKVETEKKKLSRAITVTVKPIVINVEKIIIDNPNVEMYIGDTYKLDYRIEPENATNTKLSFKSDNINIAAFNDKYEIIGVSEGEAVITASSDNGIIEKVNVKVKKREIDVSKIELNKQGLFLQIGKSETLSAKISPSNATNKNITWTSSNTSVATVNDGLVKAIGMGEAIITAKGNNNIEAKCNVVVSKEIDIENNAVKSYLADTNRNIKSHFKNNKCDKDQNCDRPKAYNSSINGNIKVYLYNSKTNKKELIKTVNDSQTLTNIMVPGNTYYLESASDNSKHEYVSVKKGLRMIYVKMTRNVRDFGGWKADGGTVKYGLIFRGGQPYEQPNDTEAVFNSIGITDIVDIRSVGDFNSDKGKMKSFTKHNTPVSGYSLKNKKSRNSVEQIMKLVVAGKSVFFHCAVGTDRTGTIALLLEGILGLSKTNLFDDYELSYFRRQVWNSGKTRTNGSFVNLYNNVKSYGTMEQEKFINWFLSESSDKNSDLKLINDFRKKMIDGSPTVYKLSNGNLVKE